MGTEIEVIGTCASSRRLKLISAYPKSAIAPLHEPWEKRRCVSTMYVHHCDSLTIGVGDVFQALSGAFAAF